MSTAFSMLIIMLAGSVEQLVQLPELIFVLSIPVDHLYPRQRHPRRHPHYQRLAVPGKRSARDRVLISTASTIVSPSALARAAIVLIRVYLQHFVGVLALDGRKCHADEERVEEVEEEVVDQGEEEAAKREVLFTLRCQGCLTVHRADDSVQEVTIASFDTSVDRDIEETEANVE